MKDASPLIVCNHLDSRIFVDKESSMEYLRGLVQQAKFRTLAGEIETIKLHGDVASVLESGTSLYEVRGQSDCYTITSVWGMS